MIGRNPENSNNIVLIHRIMREKWRRGWESGSPITHCLVIVFRPVFLQAPHSAQHGRPEHGGRHRQNPHRIATAPRRHARAAANPARPRPRGIQQRLARTHRQMRSRLAAIARLPPPLDEGQHIRKGVQIRQLPFRQSGDLQQYPNKTLLLLCKSPLVDVLTIALPINMRRKSRHLAGTIRRDHNG